MLRIAASSNTRLRMLGPRTLICAACIVFAGTPLVQTQPFGVMSSGTAAFTLDGSLAAFSRANAIVLLDLANWKTRWTARVQSGSIAALAFSHDGDRLAVASSDFRDRSLLGQPQGYLVRVHVLDTGTGRLENEVVDTDATMILDLSFTPDGSLSAGVIHADGEVLLWEVLTRRMIPLFPKKRFRNCAALFAPSGTMLAWSMTEPGAPVSFEVGLFDTARRAAVARVARGTTWSLDPVPLAFSPDGSTLAFATQERNTTGRLTEIGLCSTASRKGTRRIRTTDIDVSYLVFSGDSRSILASGFEMSGVGLDRLFYRHGGNDNRICQWDASTGRLQRKVDGEFNMVRFRNPANRLIPVPGRNLYAFVDGTGSCFFYDSASLQPKEDIPVPFPSRGESSANPQILSDLRDARHAVSIHRILALSFDPKGRILVGSSDGNISSWDIPPTRKLNGPKLGLETEAMAFSPDARMIAVARGSEADVSIVDMASGATIRSLPAFSVPAVALAFSPDGTLLAAAGIDGAIRVWSTRSWQPRPPLTGHNGTVAALAFSRDSSLLASGGDDRILRIWDLKSGAMLHSLPGHKEKISSVVFGAQNNTMASASSEDASVMLWNLGGRPTPKRLSGHTGSIRGLAFSVDGLSLAGVGDETICLWGSSTGKLIRLLAVKIGPRRGSLPPRGVARFTDTMISIAFSPDGKLMVCGGVNNTLLLWEVATGRNVTLR